MQMNIRRRRRIIIIINEIFVQIINIMNMTLKKRLKFVMVVIIEMVEVTVTVTVTVTVPHVPNIGPFVDGNHIQMSANFPLQYGICRSDEGVEVRVSQTGGSPDDAGSGSGQGQ